jgi:hypothetical protein
MFHRYATKPIPGLSLPNTEMGIQSCWEAVVPDAPKPVPDAISLQSIPSDPKAPLSEGAL